MTDTTQTQNKMLYRRFGRTELQMPIFSCGGMRYQHGWKDLPMEDIPEEIQVNLEATIHRSLEVGVSHIETARGYGPSERQLGQVLPKLPRDQMIIQTKIGPEKDPKVFRDNFYDSLDRLQLDYVDLLGLHGINNQEILDWSISPGGCLEVAREIQKEGKVRHIGFSTHGQADTIIKAIQTDQSGGFDYVNLHWYYIFQRNWPAVLEARKKDMGVFIISPNDKGGLLYKPSEKLLEICKPHHPMVFNDLFCLSRPEVHTLSLGAEKPSDFDTHLDAISLLDQANEILPDIKSRLWKARVEALGEDYAAHWSKGLPVWYETPGDINLRIILWLLNLAKSYDMTEYAKMRYNLLGNADHWFPGNNAKDLDSVDLTPALSNSPFKDKIPSLLKEAQELLGGEEKERLSQE